MCEHRSHVSEAAGQIHAFRILHVLTASCSCRSIWGIAQLATRAQVAETWKEHISIAKTIQDLYCNCSWNLDLVCAWLLSRTAGLAWITSGSRVNGWTCLLSVIAKSSVASAAPDTRLTLRCPDIFGAVLFVGRMAWQYMQHQTKGGEMKRTK